MVGYCKETNWPTLSYQPHLCWTGEKDYSSHWYPIALEHSTECQWSLWPHLRKGELDHYQPILLKETNKTRTTTKTKKEAKGKARRKFFHIALIQMGKLMTFVLVK